MNRLPACPAWTGGKGLSELQQVESMISARHCQMEIRSIDQQLSVKSLTRRDTYFHTRIHTWNVKHSIISISGRYQCAPSYQTTEWVSSSDLIFYLESLAHSHSFSLLYATDYVNNVTLWIVLFSHDYKVLSRFLFIFSLSFLFSFHFPFPTACAVCVHLPLFSISFSLENISFHVASQEGKKKYENRLLVLHLAWWWWLERERERERQACVSSSRRFSWTFKHPRDRWENDTKCT